jgi:RNA polymerase sigma factor (sigma-70 family)
MDSSEILKKAISGDLNALTILVDKYKDIAFNLAISIVKNEEDAKDITQDSFLKVLENIKSFRNESKFTTWLYRIVYNLAIQSERRRSKTDSIDSISNNLIDNQIESFDSYEKTQIIKSSLDILDENERLIVTLFYLGEKSLKEIRIITTFSVSNIKVILYRSRKKMKANIEKLNYERV